MPPKLQRLVLILLAVGMIGGGILFITGVLKDNITFFFTPSEIHQGKASVGQTFRAGGLVKEGSVLYSDDRLSVSFIITDTNQDLRVTFADRLPDLFAEGQGVVVRGELVPDGSLAADEVLAKHDENYQPVK